MHNTTAPRDGLGSHHFGFEGRLHLPLLQQLPVDALEEGMQTDVAHNSQSARGISLKQLPESKSFIKAQKVKKTMVLHVAILTRSSRSLASLLIQRG